MRGARSSQTSPAVPIPILLIEDNLEFAGLVEAILGTGSIAFKVHCADKLQAGLEILATEEIALVLCDLTLEDSSGRETFDRVRTAAPGVPVIVLSGLDDESLAVETVRLGAQDYLVKGQFDTQSLARAVRYGLERNALESQLAAYAEELRRKNAEMEAELKMARELQRAYLPEQHRRFPAAGRAGSEIHLSYRYQPASKIGGDFFDIVEISETEIGVFICDVMGHGVRAALVSAILRGLVEELKPVAGNAGAFLSAVNRGLLSSLAHAEDQIFATGFYMVLDLARQELHFANAGHPSPLCLNRATGTATPIRPPNRGCGPVLGMFGGARYEVFHKALGPEDLLVLFTDGLYEVEDGNREPYSMESLPAALERRSLLEPAELFDDLLAEIQEFSANHEFEDDVCLVGLEVKSGG